MGKPQPGQGRDELTGAGRATTVRPGTGMERSGRSRGKVLRRGALGIALLLVPAGCGGGTGAEKPPTFAQTVSLRPVTGQVRVAVGPGAFVALTQRRVVPVGTLVDASAGSVELTSATAAPTRLQTGRFHGGVFEIRQSPAERGLTELVIRDRVPRARACPVPTARILGLLRGSATGRFRTTGRFAAGTVRGTEWGVRDRCDGTLVVVTRGAVTVRDFRLGRNVAVGAGHTYLAAAS